jgi:hypothetical protein
MESETSTPMALARRKTGLTMKIPCTVASQHTKAGARDHGLNRNRDAIVIWLRGTAKQRPAATPAGPSVAAHPDVVKMPSCVD